MISITTNDETGVATPNRRLNSRFWLLSGILVLLTLMLGMQETAAESATQLSPIVGQHNRIAQPTLTVRPGAAIRMPQLTVARTPILGSANAIQQPTLSVAKVPILGSANAIQRPTLTIAKAPILGSTNAIQQPQLALSSLQVQVRAVRLPILSNAIVQPRLDSTFGATTTPHTMVGLPTTGSGIADRSMLPNLLVLLLAGLAVAAFGLAIRVQHQIVDPSGQRQPHRPHLTEIHPTHPLMRYGGDPTA